MASSRRRDNIFRIRAKDRLIGEKLASENISDHIKGKPLRIPQFNFTISLENKVRSMFGPPHYASRAGRIENILYKLMEDLKFEYAEMIDKFGDAPELFAEHWKELVNALELDEINGLIDQHNAYYPIEANLQIDSDSGTYLIGSVPWEPMKKITTEMLLIQFPLDGSAAVP